MTAFNLDGFEAEGSSLAKRTSDAVSGSDFNFDIGRNLGNSGTLTAFAAFGFPSTKLVNVATLSTFHPFAFGTISISASRSLATVHPFNFGASKLTGTRTESAFTAFHFGTGSIGNMRGVTPFSAVAFSATKLEGRRAASHLNAFAFGTDSRGALRSLNSFPAVNVRTPQLTSISLAATLHFAFGATSRVSQSTAAAFSCVTFGINALSGEHRLSTVSPFTFHQGLIGESEASGRQVVPFSAFAFSTVGPLSHGPLYAQGLDRLIRVRVGVK